MVSNDSVTEGRLLRSRVVAPLTNSMKHTGPANAEPEIAPAPATQTRSAQPVSAPKSKVAAPGSKEAVASANAFEPLAEKSGGQPPQDKTTAAASQKQPKPTTAIANGRQSNNSHVLLPNETAGASSQKRPAFVTIDGSQAKKSRTQFEALVPKRPAQPEGNAPNSAKKQPLPVGTKGKECSQARPPPVPRTSNLVPPQQAKRSADEAAKKQPTPTTATQPQAKKPRPEDPQTQRADPSKSLNSAPSRTVAAAQGGGKGKGPTMRTQLAMKPVPVQQPAKTRNATASEDELARKQMIKKNAELRALGALPAKWARVKENCPAADREFQEKQQKQLSQAKMVLAAAENRLARMEILRMQRGGLTAEEMEKMEVHLKRIAVYQQRVRDLTAQLNPVSGAKAIIRPDSLRPKLDFDSRMAGWLSSLPQRAESYETDAQAAASMAQQKTHAKQPQANTSQPRVRGTETPCPRADFTPELSTPSHLRHVAPAAQSESRPAPSDFLDELMGEEEEEEEDFSESSSQYEERRSERRLLSMAMLVMMVDMDKRAEEDAVMEAVAEDYVQDYIHEKPGPDAGLPRLRE